MVLHLTTHPAPASAPRIFGRGRNGVTLSGDARGRSKAAPLLLTMQIGT